MSRLFDRDKQKDVPILALVAEVDNFALQNSTPTILSYTVPSDGRNHTVSFAGAEIVTSALTGGSVLAAVTDAVSGKSNPTITLWSASNAAGLWQMSGAVIPYVLSPGSTVVVTQGSAATLGAGYVNLRIFSD